MKAAMMALALATVAMAWPAAPVEADTYVRGYTRRDGTYVPPHHRTTPDSSRGNNYGSQGNVNPWTGQPGTVNPYAPPPLPTIPTYPPYPGSR
jgi:hypothetical protein